MRNWISGNEKIDNFIQERQLKVKDYKDVVFEWIPYNQFDQIKKIGKNDLLTVYSAMWRDGPLCKKDWWSKYCTRDSNKEVALKLLHNSQDSIELINEVKKYSTKNNEFLVLYGVSQNPDTKNFILVQNNPINLRNWISGNEKIDNFIQERQLKVKYYKDVVSEWIPYNQFDQIKKIGKNSLMTVYSAIWKDGPLYYQYNKYTRDSNREVTLKVLHNSQNSIEFVINKVKKYSTRNEEYMVLHGISQSSDTNDYILVFKWISEDEKIDYLIQERQLKINKHKNVVFEWIPYSQFDQIKKVYKNNIMTVYSALWKDGPLYKKYNWSNYRTRDSNKEVALKFFHNSQNSIEFVINEVKKYSTKNVKFQVLYGISQNPYTYDYILVFNWTSGNEKIDNFIQERQLKINDHKDVVFEWLPYNQFNKIEEIGKNNSITVYSATWKDSPLYKKYNWSENYARESSNKVVLKFLNNSQNSIEFVINEVKKYQTENHAFLTFGNEKIDNFIQERQFAIKNYNNVVFEWIPYNQFDQIKEIYKNILITVFSATWRGGPLYKKYNWSKFYTRDSNKEVVLKFLNNSQNSIEFVINEVKKYSIKNNEFLVLYEITQNPDTNDYILVLNQTSGNEKIDKFVQERQLTIKYHKYVAFEWIPCNYFDQIKEIYKNGLITVYSAIWRGGPLYKMYKWSENYIRNSNKEVTLKLLHNSQNSIEFVINEVKKYSTKFDEFLVLYGISQNPDTKNYILIFNNILLENYCAKCNKIYTNIQYNWCKLCNFMSWKSGNNRIDNLIQLLKINEPSDTRFEWIPYDQFNKIRTIGKGHFVTAYSATWKYKVTLLCFSDLQRFLDKPQIDGLSQNSDKDYILVLQTEVSREYGKVFCKNCGGKFTHIGYMWCKPCQINKSTKWTNGNEKLVISLIQEMQLRINSCFNIVFEWIPYDQFNYIKEIGKGGFSTVYSAIWKDGPLKYNVEEKIYTRVSNKKIALKCLNNSQNLTDKFLNEVKEYSINKKSDILYVYGISQNPNTKDLIIVLEYAEGGSYYNWINNNCKNFDWKNKIQTLIYIIEGLKGIHQNQKVHHDLHPGNILFLTKSLNTFNRKSLFISDMGLCEDVNNVSEVKSYGIIPYMAPEVLKYEAYTQAADIYSFGMIMYFTATGKQPFVNCAHDYYLMLDICKGIRPEINELKAPKCYIELMKRCWNSNPDNRPNATKIHELIESFYDSYNSYKNDESNAIKIKKQFIEAEIYRKSCLSTFKKNKQHPQAIYTSQLVPNYFMKELLKSEYLSCAISD
ncbi:Cmk2p [Rhizophagus irregularis DAOM 197198w]|uniref:Cmk2p n=2 Tax=Rhizophagus irregularis TaxID=588596 RepID=A0A015KG96_RHIIW|nr:Cmk2p [Rhizophagus irregularis DAOM 197198w]